MIQLASTSATRERGRSRADEAIRAISRAIPASRARLRSPLSAETSLFIVVQVGAALVFAGLLWLIVKAFQARVGWGLAVLLFPPSGLVFALRHRKRAAWPLMVMLVGAGVATAPILYNRLMPPDLGPHVSTVGGEQHVTITGWDRRDYSVLASFPEVVVLQMANPDVTDATLDDLRGMTRLRELDLGGSQVTDAGLARLEGLTALESLRLKGTRVTDDGFARWLSNRDRLRQLDLRGTQVTPEAGKAWRAARPGRRLMQ